MSSAIEINGITLIPGKEAAKKAGYSSDYIARLAREQKIVGTQIDRQWFIDEASLDHFLESARIEKEARKRKLQEERAQERTLREERVRMQQQQEQQVHGTRVNSLVSAGVATLLLCMVGIGAVNLYATMADSNNVAQLNSTRTPLSEQTSASDQSADGTVAPRYSTAAIPTASTTFGEGVLVLAPETGTTTVAEVSERFSDPVTVEFVNQQTGRVVFESDGTRTVYPVVLVPNVE